MEQSKARKAKPCVLFTMSFYLIIHHKANLLATGSPSAETNAQGNSSKSQVNIARPRRGCSVNRRSCETAEPMG